MLLKYDALYNPYASKRQVVYGRNGMTATSQPLAAQAGLQIMQQGGNAIDAAVAMAACLTVVEPTSNGIGGDAFALVWVKDKLYGLNASGKSPQAISVQEVKKQNYHEMPKYGWIPVTVPGAPSAWVELVRRFGNLSLNKVLAPAIAYARNGYAVSPIVSKFWQRAVRIYSEHGQGSEFAAWFQTFAPKNRAPFTGEMFFLPDHANTLEEIALTNGESFYRGNIAHKIAQTAKDQGGYLSFTDLAEHKPTWVDPLKVNYRGYDVWEMPPNGQGIVALMALNILQGYKVNELTRPELIHRQIEAIKLAFGNAKHYITDDAQMNFSLEKLLSTNFAERQRSLISDTALNIDDVDPYTGGTVYLATADNEGNMVSFIQSNYMGFGSGIVIPQTGIAMQNRGADFSLKENNINVLQGGKKSYHTIIPGFLSRAGKAIGPFGVMGGYMQPQGHVQVLMNAIDFGMSPQSVLDAPRWQWIKDKTVQVENSFPAHIAELLAKKGHDIEYCLESGFFGRGQFICRNTTTGVLAGGTDPRADGNVLAW